MKFLTLFFGLFAFFTLQGQNPTANLQPLQRITVPYHSFLGFDTFGATYGLVNAELVKTQGTQTYKYQNFALGKPCFVDLQNPLQLVLFYKNMNAVVLLDNQLNETFRLNFSETNPQLIPTHIGLAAQNQLWLFDAASQKIGLYNLKNKTFLALTPTWTSLPIFTSSNYNYFFWIDQNAQLFAVSLFGKITPLGIIPQGTAYQIVNDETVLITQDTGYYYFNTQTKKMTILPVAEKTAQKVLLLDQILAIFTPAEIQFFNITLP